MTNALTTLEFNRMPVRIEMVDQEPHFVAKDLCDILGIRTTDAIQRLDQDEVVEVDINNLRGSCVKMKAVSESGMYNLIFTSRLPQAQQFKRWVTHEVLPSLRKNGRYEVQSALPTTSVTPRNTLAVAKQLLIVAEEHETRLSSLERRQEELEQRPNLLAAPPEGILFPKMNPNYMKLGEYCQEIGIKLTTNQRCGIGQRLAHYCRKVGIFYLPNTGHGASYPVPVLQEFFKE